MSINLKTKNSKNDGDKIQFGKALPFIVVILVVILIAYGAILFFQSRIISQINVEQNTLGQKIQEFRNGDAKNVLDFQNRISESNKLLVQYVDNLYFLDKIQKDIIPGVFLSGLEFSAETGELVLDCRAQNYENVSKQILSFKKDDFFSKVDAGKTSVLEQEGLVSFEVTLHFAKDFMLKN